MRKHISSSQPASIVPPPRLRLLAEGEERETLSHALRARRAWAERALLDEHTPFVEQLLTGILGFESELDDLVQDVFVRALWRIDDLRDDNIRSWIGAFAVNVAREAIRRRKRKGWLRFAAPEEIPDLPACDATPEMRDAVRALYALLAKMDCDERVVFTLRVIEGMQLSEIAAVCHVSLSTVKRRIQRAEDWFFTEAEREPRLSEWVRP